MALFLTGDTHADFSRFKKGMYPDLDALTKEDYVLICGDFGGVWIDDPKERHWLDWLDAKPFTTLFVSGNHENFDRLYTLPAGPWHGGIVRYVRPSILLLTRGQIFDIDGKSIFTMGGASSHDMPGGLLEPNDPFLKRKCRRLNQRGIPYRINHLTWWKEELPSGEEYRTARENLERVNWTVDYIVTHCCPSSVQDLITGGTGYPQNDLTEFLEEVYQKCQFRDWFFGHYHDNKMIGEKFILLYEQVIRLR